MRILSELILVDRKESQLITMFQCHQEVVSLHTTTMHSSETFTIASTEGTVAAGPLDVQGTVNVQGSLVIL